MLSNFTPQDISCASYLTKLIWGDEMVRLASFSIITNLSNQADLG